MTRDSVFWRLHCAIGIYVFYWIQSIKRCVQNDFLYWQRLTFAVNCIFQKLIPWSIIQFNRYQYISYWLRRNFHNVCKSCDCLNSDASVYYCVRTKTFIFLMLFLFLNIFKSYFKCFQSHLILLFGKKYLLYIL